MFVSNVGFVLAHFVYKKRFGEIWVKLLSDPFDLKISISGIYKVLISNLGFAPAHFKYKESSEPMWVRISE